MNRTAALAPCLGMIALLAACSGPKGADREGAPNGKSLASSDAGTVTSPEGVVYTANERGQSISVIDLRTGQVTAVATPFTPHNVQISRDGRLLLVVGPVAEMPTNGPKMKMADGATMTRGRLWILDGATLASERAVNIEIGRHPAHVIIDAPGTRAYATNSEDDNVVVVDVALRRVVSKIRTGTFPHGLRISPNGREIYVANVKDNSVSVLDAMESREVARIPVGKAPVQVGFTPDGGRAYVSLRDENSVAVVNTADRKKVATVAVGRNPIQVFVTPDGRHVYVANQGSDAEPDSTVSVIDVGTNRVIATIVTGRGAHGVVVSNDGKFAFISNIEANTVSVIDTATLKVIKTFKVGDGPNGITFRGR